MAILAFLPLVLLASPPSSALASSVPCEKDSVVCEQTIGQGSQCRTDGFCSNPFEQGCLQKLLPNWTKQRVCNSDDPPNGAEIGLCKEPEIEYNEIRIHAANWDSSFFLTWIAQIVLSEILGVPTTVETGSPDALVSLYNKHNRKDYSSSTLFFEKSFNNSVKYLDCTKASRDPERYEPCAHTMLEAWDFASEYRSYMFGENGPLEPVEILGAVGQAGWYIPKFTAMRDPSLLSYFGMQGEANRRKLADRFLRPTSWKEYCDLVSPKNCSEPDLIAARPPTARNESTRYFVPGLYSGHFRKTEENNCDKNNATCTGHFADYPCGWVTYFAVQAHYLDISLESNGPELTRGYSYTQLAEIWYAAYVTGSDVIMNWWFPEIVGESMRGTEAEFVKVALPQPIPKCATDRLNFDKKIVDSCEVFEAFPDKDLAVCDAPPVLLEKIKAKSVFETSKASSIPTGLQSPAFDFLSLLRISDLEIIEIFDYKKKYPTSREATCQWVVDNIEKINTFVPREYPRTLQEADQDGLLRYISTSVALVAIIGILVTGCLVYLRRREKVMIFAQIEFLYLLLGGLLLVSIGAVLVASPPSDALCVATIWLIMIGYTIELVPLIIKVVAVNKMMSAAQRMRRVKINKRMLFKAVAAVLALIVLFLVIWTVIDPPRSQTNYDLTDQTSGDYTVVEVSYHCGSDTDAWVFAAISWNAILLLVSTILAFQTRKLRQEFNESTTLALMVYSHMLFVILRLVLFSLSSTSSSSLRYFLSLVYSIDAIGALILYFVPKLLVGSAIASQSSRLKKNWMMSNQHINPKCPTPEKSGRNNSSILTELKQASSTNDLQHPELHSSGEDNQLTTLPEASADGEQQAPPIEDAEPTSMEETASVWDDLSPSPPETNPVESIEDISTDKVLQAEKGAGELNV